MLERAGIQLTAGREAKRYKRLAPEQRAKLIEVRKAKPEATPAEVAREAGVSRPTVSQLAPGPGAAAQGREDFAGR